MFSGELKDYRQPMVTSLGIIMGFLLNFLANWAIEEDGESAISTMSDWLIVMTLIVSLILMIWVLARLLNNRLNKENSDEYYYRTFKLYIASVSLSFLGILVALFL